MRPSAKAKKLSPRTIGLQTTAKTVIVALDGNREKYGTRTVWSAGKDSRDYAHNLFALLRRSDDEKADVVLCESVTDDGYGLGVENRLGKASGGKTL